MEYVALLRGINSGANPSQKMDNLRRIFEDLGFRNVQTVIASGNVLFKSAENNKDKLTKMIEAALKEKTGAETITILRTKAEIQSLINSQPFKKVQESPKAKPHATFLKFPEELTNKNITLKGNSKILSLFRGTICYVVDLTTSKTPEVMGVMEREFNKNITTRTWKTVEKILAKF